MAGESISADLLVSILHHGDSGFPSGGFAFSSGLEEFFADQTIKNVAELESFIADLLVHRWISFDAVALRRSFAAASDNELAEIDRCVEIATLSAAQRAGSKRAGRAVLAVYAKLGSKVVGTYRDRAIADEELGHLPVAQGLAWREAGLPIEAALVMIGHLQAQHLLFGMRAQVVAAVQSGADYPLDAPLSSFTILSDIAQARHERRDARMFIT